MVNASIEDLEDPDLISENVITQGDYSYKLRMKNPYAVYEFVAERGQLPEDLRGNFTTKYHAQVALNKYVAKKSNEGIIARKYLENLEAPLEPLPAKKTKVK